MMINGSMFSFAYVKTCSRNYSERKTSYGLTEREKKPTIKKEGGGAGLQ